MADKPVNKKRGEHGGDPHGHPGGPADPHTPDMGDMHEFVPPLEPGDPGPDALTRGVSAARAVYLADSPVAVTLADNPAPDASLGFVGRFVRLEAPGSPFPPGTLVAALDAAQIGTVARETLRVFRWDADRTAYRLIHRSGLGQTRDYVWASLWESGLYAAIGVNTHPLIARTLGLMRFLEGWFEAMDPERRRRLQQRVWDLLWGDPGLHELLRDPVVAQRLIDDNARLGLRGKWRPGFAGSPEVGRALSVSGQPPETQLLALNMSPPAAVGHWDPQRRPWTLRSSPSTPRSSAPGRCCTSPATSTTSTSTRREPSITLGYGTRSATPSRSSPRRPTTTSSAPVTRSWAMAGCSSPGAPRRFRGSRGTAGPATSPAFGRRPSSIPCSPPGRIPGRR